jgi:hypothetical protein
VVAPGERWADNPFFVLELTPAATRAEIERAGAKLLAMLEIAMQRAAIYTTPVGPRARTPELVRSAMAELRNPERRVVHEAWWIAVEPTGEANQQDADDDIVDPPRGTTSQWSFDAPALLGWCR